MNWRNKIEKDLNEVLQSNYIFTNVSKGVQANNADLMAAFHTTSYETIAIEILAKGEVQVSEKERAAELEAAFKDIASIVSEKTVNRETNRPFSIGMIERSMRELHFNIKRNHTNGTWMSPLPAASCAT
jgi:ribosome maturation protein SDO1